MKMTIYEKILLYYLVAGIVVGGLVSAMDTVNFNFRGKPFPDPRVAAGLISGIIWPAVVWQMAGWRKH
jgi:hypothetical protein